MIALLAPILEVSLTGPDQFCFGQGMNAYVEWQNGLLLPEDSTPNLVT